MIDLNTVNPRLQISRINLVSKFYMIKYMANRHEHIVNELRL